LQGEYSRNEVLSLMGKSGKQIPGWEAIAAEENGLNAGDFCSLECLIKYFQKVRRNLNKREKASV
jgi:hypothetical protein